MLPAAQPGVRVFTNSSSSSGGPFIPSVNDPWYRSPCDSSRAARWRRIWIVMVILSIIQCFTSIYIYLGISHFIFFAGYLSYALLSAVMMIFRVKYGLVWFGIGGLLYCCWVSVLTYEASQAKDWVKVCFDFALAAFEFLVFCLTFSAFHEHHGFAPCGFEPSTEWRGALLVGGGGQTPYERVPTSRPQFVDESEYDHDQSSTRFLNQNLLSGRESLNGQYHTTTAGYRSGQQYIPPHDGAVSVAGSVDSHDMFGIDIPASHISSASSSYNKTVGRAELVYVSTGGSSSRDGSGTSPVSRSDLHSFQDEPIITSKNGDAYSTSFTLQRGLLPLDHRIIQQQQRQMDEDEHGDHEHEYGLSRDVSFNSK